MPEAVAGLVAPVERIASRAPCIPRAVYPTEQDAPPFFQQAQPMSCGSDCRPKKVLWSLLKAFAIACQAAGAWSASRIGGWSGARWLAGGAPTRLTPAEGPCAAQTLTKPPH